MRSSTSSSERGSASAWRRSVIGAAVASLVLACALEFFFRAQGFEPAHTDNNGLWTVAYDDLLRGPGGVALIGSSRMACDVNLDVFAEEYGEKPVQLAIVASSPLPILEHLAHETRFDGTVLCEVSPLLYFGPDRVYARNAERRLRTWRTAAAGPFGIPEERALRWLQDRLAILNSSLKIDELLKSAMRGELPQEDRRHSFRADRARFFWRDPATRAPDMDPPSVASVTGMDDRELEILARSKSAVAEIRARGGEVVFCYLPCRGDTRYIELDRFPEALFWDRLLSETGSRGIHSRRDAVLSDFVPLVDYSHLSTDQHGDFTRRLAELLLDGR